jgi:hypothetical protein
LGVERHCTPVLEFSLYIKNEEKDLKDSTHRDHSSSSAPGRIFLTGVLLWISVMKNKGTNELRERDRLNLALRNHHKFQADDDLRAR